MGERLIAGRESGDLRQIEECRRKIGDKAECWELAGVCPVILFSSKRRYARIRWAGKIQNVFWIPPACSDDKLFLACVQTCCHSRRSSLSLIINTSDVKIYLVIPILQQHQGKSGENKGGIEKILPCKGGDFFYSGDSGPLSRRRVSLIFPGIINLMGMIRRILFCMGNPDKGDFGE